MIRSLISFSCGFPGARDPRDAVDGSCCVAEDEVDGGSRRPQPEDVYLVKNKKLKERNSGKIWTPRW